jgi:hypothetical protein
VNRDATETRLPSQKMRLSRDTPFFCDGFVEKRLLQIACAGWA